jgi:lipopolysaccharide/colanic/teichoic acid biosynthesis glycosyltransferase
MSSGILIRKQKAASVIQVFADRSEIPSPGLRPSPYFDWKRAVDWTLAVALAVPAAPVVAMLALLVRLTSRGPAVYRQKRVGKHGRPFLLYKLRTMRVDAEARTGAVWSTVNDPRVTRLGRVLRRLHLDELPQLLNVLRGEMSLVGPRPERPEFVEILSRQIPRYRDRLAVLPGVTGLAQLNLPPDTDAGDVQRKIILDTEYVRRASLWMDIRIIVCTGLRIIKLPAIRLFGLHRRVPDAVPDAPATASSKEGDQRPLTPDLIKAHSASDPRWAPGQHSANGRNRTGKGSEIHKNRPR